VLDAIRAAGAIPVLPWGVGKWLGARGRIVADVLRSSPPRSVCIGDNGGRWRALPAPLQFALAAQRGIVILPGSDPLPLAHDVRRVCSYVCTLEGAIDPGAPGRSIIESLAGLALSPAPRGSRVGLVTFVRNQVALRLSRRA
jgi:hypothetical protein